VTLGTRRGSVAPRSQEPEAAADLSGGTNDARGQCAHVCVSLLGCWNAPSGWGRAAASASWRASFVPASKWKLLGLGLEHAAPSPEVGQPLTEGKAHLQSSLVVQPGPLTAEASELHSRVREGHTQRARERARARARERERESSCNAQLQGAQSPSDQASARLFHSIRAVLQERPSCSQAGVRPAFRGHAVAADSQVRAGCAGKSLRVDVNCTKPEVSHSPGLGERDVSLGRALSCDHAPPRPARQRAFQPCVTTESSLLSTC
jgi:hypothetical protein